MKHAHELLLYNMMITIPALSDKGFDRPRSFPPPPLSHPSRQYSSVVPAPSLFFPAPPDAAAAVAAAGAVAAEAAAVRAVPADAGVAGVVAPSQLDAASPPRAASAVPRAASVVFEPRPAVAVAAVDSKHGKGRDSREKYDYKNGHGSLVALESRCSLIFRRHSKDRSCACTTPTC